MILLGSATYFVGRDDGISQAIGHFLAAHIAFVLSWTLALWGGQAA
jgi:hypothetical protein